MEKKSEYVNQKLEEVKELANKNQETYGYDKSLGHFYIALKMLIKGIEDTGQIDKIEKEGIDELLKLCQETNIPKGR